MGVETGCGIGSGFGEPCGTPLLRIPRGKPPPRNLLPLIVAHVILQMTHRPE